MRAKLIENIAIGLFAAFAYPVIATFFGALSGWTVGLFFEGTIKEGLATFGVSATATMWQIGAALGFVGGYFRSVVKG